MTSLFTLASVLLFWDLSKNKLTGYSSLTFRTPIENRFRESITAGIRSFSDLSRITIMIPLYLREKEGMDCVGPRRFRDSDWKIIE